MRDASTDAKLVACMTIPSSLAVCVVTEVTSLRRVEFEILVILGLGPMHGYRVLQEVEARTGRAPGMTTLYRALARLADRGLVEPVEIDTDDDRRETFALTEEGRRAASAEAHRLRSLLRVAGRAELLGPSAP